MRQEALILHLSTLRVTIRFTDAEHACATLRAVWHHAERLQYVPTRHEVEYEVSREAGRFRLLIDGGSVRYAEVEEDVPPFVEGAFYTDFLRTQATDGLTVMHASCCVSNDTPFLFLGTSGSGKSALARAAVDRGFSYLGDEHIVVDDRSLWGLPRSIHMDALAQGAPTLPWHRGADLESYRCRSATGAWFCMPLAHVPAARVAGQAAETARAVLVAARRGSADSIRQLSLAERITALNASNFVPGPALKALALVPQAFELVWKDPGSALSRVLELAAQGRDS